jgi:superfamily II DNA or RNA helicase
MISGMATRMDEGALPLRPYQLEDVERVERDWASGVRRPAVVVATGLGKSVESAHLATRWLQRERLAGSARRVLKIVHRREIVEQLAAKVRDVAPALRVGIVQAGRNETGADVICASVQTLASERRRRMVRGVGLLIVDECHHAAAVSYLAVLKHYGCMPEAGPGHEGEDALAAGFTATLTRSDARSLGDVWQKVSTTRDIAYGVREGFLVRPFGKHVAVANLDLGKVKTSRGDYQAADLGEAIEGSLAPEAIADALLEHAVLPDGRMRPTFLFAPLVSTAELIAKVLCERGIRAVAMHGATTPQERDKGLRDLANGAVQVICNPMIFTEGTDVPAVSCVVVARPTKSRGLFIQMIGRALRPDRASGKTDALILDVVGASRGNSLSLPVDLFGAEEAREKEEIDGLEELDDLVADEQVELEDLAADESWLNGPLRTTDIDLFQGSDSAWLRTGAGVWFVPAGDRYIAILPGVVESHFDVVAMHKDRVGVSRWVARDVSDLGMAMSRAEGDVTSSERVTAGRSRNWRANRPSDKMLNFARRLGIMPTPGQSGGELSSQITVWLATRRIDPYLQPHMMRGLGL